MGDGGSEVVVIPWGMEFGELLCWTAMAWGGESRTTRSIAAYVQVLD